MLAALARALRFASISLHYQDGSYSTPEGTPIIGFTAKVYVYDDDGPIQTEVFPTIEACLLEACRIANVVD